MAASFSQDHIGVLTVESRPDLSTRIERVTLGQAQEAMAELAASRSPVVSNQDGDVWVINGLAFVAARWSPDRPSWGSDTTDWSAP